MLVSKAAQSDGRVMAEAAVLRAGGWRVTVLGWDRGKRFPAEAAEDGLRILDRGPAGEHGGGLGQLGGYLVYWLRALHWMLREPWEVVHAHDLDTLPAAWLAARLTGRRVIFDGHEPYAEAFAKALPAGAARVLATLERLLVRRVDGAVVPSAEIAAYYGPLRGTPPLVFENYKDPAEFRVGAEAVQATRAALGATDRLLVVHAGLLDHHVCLDRLVAAVSDEDGVTLAIAGPGRLGPWAAAEAGRHPSVRYLGQVSAADARRLVAAADVVNCLVELPPAMLRWGAASNKLYDALAAGRAVLCSSATAGMRAIVERWACGTVVAAPVTVDGVRAALARWRDDRAALRAAQEGAAAAAAAEFNRARAAGRLLEAYGMGRGVA